MLIKPSNQRLIIIIGSFLLLVGTVYIFLSFVYPSFQEIQTLRAERQARLELKKEQEDAEKKISELTKFYTDELSDTQRLFSSYLPVGPEAPVVLNHLQGIARNNGLDVSSISFQYQPVRPSPADSLIKEVGVLRITMSMVGRYEELKTFISQVETNVRILDVHSLRVDGGAVPRKEEFDYTLTVDAYYQVP